MDRWNQKVRWNLKLFILGICALLVFSLVPGSAQFAEAAESLAKHKGHSAKDRIVSIPDTAIAAKVILIPTDLLFNHPIDEKGLIEIGCTFDTQNSLHISRLINILNNANIKVNNSINVFRFFENREGIYLTLENGTKFKFLFAPAYTQDDPIVGSFHKSSFAKELYVTANQSLPLELLHWAADLGKLVSNQKAEDQLKCDDFINMSGPYRKIP